MRIERILLVTGRAAEELVREAAREAAKRYNVTIDVVVLPVWVASSISEEHVMHYLPKLKPDYKSYDVIMLPGRCRADVSRISRVLGVRVVRGPISAVDIVKAIGLLLQGAEDFGSAVIERIEETVSKVFARATRICVGNLCVYRRPAYTLAVEVPARLLKDSQPDKLVALVLEGDPDIVVFGDDPEISDEEFLKLFRKFVDLLPSRVPYGIETESARRIVKAVEEGAKLVSGVSPSLIDELEIPRDTFIVLQPIDPRRPYPRGVRERVEMLKYGVKRALERGFQNIILDPVLVPPPLGLTNVVEAMERLVKELDYPILFSLASIEDALATDAFPIFLLAAGIGIELGADFYWVVAKRGYEASEARLALDVMVAAREKQMLVSDLGLDLRVLSSHEAKPSLLGAYDEVIIVDKHVEPSTYDRGYVRVFVSRDEILVEYIEGKRKVLIRGKDGLSIARLLVKKFGLNPEHAAYIGYELAKAELAAKYGMAYMQDEPLEPVFRRYRVSARR